MTATFQRLYVVVILDAMVMTFSYIQQDMDLLCRLPFVQVKRMYRCRRYPGCCLNREAQAAARGIMWWPVRRVDSGSSVSRSLAWAILVLRRDLGCEGEIWTRDSG